MYMKYHSVDNINITIYYNYNYNDYALNAIIMLI